MNIEITIESCTKMEDISMRDTIDYTPTDRTREKSERLYWELLDSKQNIEHTNILEKQRSMKYTNLVRSQSVSGNNQPSICGSIYSGFNKESEEAIDTELSESLKFGILVLFVVSSR